MKSRTGRPESTNPRMWKPKMTKEEYAQYCSGEIVSMNPGNGGKNAEFRESIRKFRELTKRPK